jgi:polyisoprenoid-binding protein YceI
MRRLFAALFFASLLSSPAAAATWNVDHAKSRLGFIVQWSGEPFSATFNSWNADITFDPSDVAHAKASVTIDLGSEASNSPDNDDGLKGPEGFSISQFPTARFDTTGFKSRGNGDYVAAGRLTIHGVTRPLTLPFKLTIAGNVAHMTGRVTVLRTDFGLGRGEWASAATIAHEVAITIDLTATKSH